MDARSFHILPDDLPSRHMCGDDVFSPLRIHPIIQGSGAARSRQRRKPAAEQRRGVRGEDLPHQHVGALGTPAETALPLELGVLSRTMCGERRLEDLAERCRAVAVSALRTAADQDLEATRHSLLSVTGARRPVNPRTRAGAARANRPRQAARAACASLAPRVLERAIRVACRHGRRSFVRRSVSAPLIADSVTTSPWIQRFCRS